MNVQILQTPFFVFLPASDKCPEEFLNLASIYTVALKRNPHCVKVFFLNGKTAYYHGIRATELISRLENLPGCNLPDE